MPPLRGTLNCTDSATPGRLRRDLCDSRLQETLRCAYSTVFPQFVTGLPVLTCLVAHVFGLALGAILRLLALGAILRPLVHGLAEGPFARWLPLPPAVHSCLSSSSCFVSTTWCSSLSSLSTSSSCSRPFTSRSLLLLAPLRDGFLLLCLSGTLSSACPFAGWLPRLPPAPSQCHSSTRVSSCYLELLLAETLSLGGLTILVSWLFWPRDCFVLVRFWYVSLC